MMPDPLEVDLAAAPSDLRPQVARAVGSVRMSRATLALVEAGTAAKGDVLGVARLAGIMAAKRAADLIPLVAPLTLSKASLNFVIDGDMPGVRIEASVAARASLAADTAAMAALTVAALTVYDMLKAAQKELRIEGIRLVPADEEKTAGVEPEPEAAAQ